MLSSTVHAGGAVHALHCVLGLRRRPWALPRRSARKWDKSVDTRQLDVNTGSERYTGWAYLRAFTVCDVRFGPSLQQSCTLGSRVAPSYAKARQQGDIFREWFSKIASQKCFCESRFSYHSLCSCIPHIIYVLCRYRQMHG